ncbi:MAG: NifU family protein [Bacteroidia bacterium]|nr:NifU family protein [Bacteroidia bacterium]MDW8301346.1 NifU family protein [Bacteroidia bacterium]
MELYTEYTPNPDTLKFVLTKVIMPFGTAEFADAESAKRSGLAAELFAMNFVTRVFFGANFVTVTKRPEFEWDAIIPHIGEVILKYVQSGKPIVENVENIEEEDTDPVVKKIKEIIETHIRPAVAMDGGDVIFKGFKDGVVHLQMQGSCHGCPSSTLTLKAGIEGLLTRMIPEVKEVVQV